MVIDLWPKKISKIHKMHAFNQIYVFSKFWRLRYKITWNQFQKTLQKSSLLVFYEFFSQHFSNRIYPSVKIILAYFYIIKTITTKFITIFLAHLFNGFHIILYKINNNKYLLNLRYFSNNFMSFILKYIVDLLTLISLSISLNLSHSLNFINKSPCLYAKLRIPLFLHFTIFSYYLTYVLRF